jgi:hypothetical protein
MKQIARMLDLYLALENAYQHYGHPDHANTSTTNLLGTTDKELVLENYARKTDDLDDLANLEVPFGGTGVNMDEVQVDTSTLPSGTYLYRLRAGAFTETRRMVVVR